MNKLDAASHSDSKIGSNSSSGLAKLAKVLSSTKLWTKASGIKKKKSLKIFYKVGSKIEPLGTPEMVVSNSLCSLFFELIVCDLLNKNRYSKANHCLAHMLGVLQSIYRVVCS